MIENYFKKTTPSTVRGKNKLSKSCQGKKNTAGIRVNI
jgi:hypothetical protein